MGMQNSVVTMENSVAVSQNIKNLITVWSNNISGDIPKDLKAETERGICTLFSTAALLTAVKRWKQSKCLLTDKWIIKMWWNTHNGLFGLKK